MDEPCEPPSSFLIQEVAFPGDDDFGLYETRLFRFSIHGDNFYIHASSEMGDEMEVVTLGHGACISSFHRDEKNGEWRVEIDKMEKRLGLRCARRSK